MPQMISSIKVSENTKGEVSGSYKGRKREEFILKCFLLFRYQVSKKKIFQGCHLQFSGQREGAGASREGKLLPQGGLPTASQFNQLSAGRHGASALQSSAWIYGSQCCYFLGASSFLSA